MNCNTLISLVAFKVIFLAAVFLFIRNYPCDRWFSVIFIVAGGVLAWNTAEMESEPEMESVDETEMESDPESEPVDEENKKLYSPDTS